ncbi:hypothetical protein BGX23_006046 [Mortierella sp. AD031]|nr:hypothetical protein BGX23_006046 [Mortierella sp. AD031]
MQTCMQQAYEDLTAEHHQEFEEREEHFDTGYTELVERHMDKYNTVEQKHDKLRHQDHLNLTALQSQYPYQY